MNDMRTIFSIVSLLISNIIFAQDVSKQLQEKIAALEKDPQFKHAILSMYVVDSKTGKVVFDKNSEVGLAPASCQKVITSVSAFELLGKGYRYKTEIGYSKPESPKYNAGNLLIKGFGDPTLGSWRWKQTTDSSIFKKIGSILKKKKLLSFEGGIYVDDLLYGLQTAPKGWIYEDIGNYYGAACFGLNWYENLYNLTLQPGSKLGDEATVVKIEPHHYEQLFINKITTGEEGSGDNAIIYSMPFSNVITTSGTIQKQKEPFIIKGSMTEPALIFSYDLLNYFTGSNVSINGAAYAKGQNTLRHIPFFEYQNTIDSIFSPQLDSINYWFLKKSINLYGEAFVKTIGYEKKGVGDIDTGLSIIKYFWKQRGIEPSAINIIDGSGLSPANRVTANALVNVMQYAKKQNWYSSFYNALPEMNGIKMKDGYISGVRSYTGYVKSKIGNEYTFALIVNNFDGSAATVREKLWKVLDEMK
jgi:serine-type D-Ala-D-Ala carboxypeptidase/endopeptidase (penicillin-binding protein 4)